VLLLVAVAIEGAALAAPAEEPIPPTFQSCFGEDPLEPKGTGVSVPPARVPEATRAFASARSYRACFSYISLFQGASWGQLEYVEPDRRRWRVRYRGRKDSDPTGALEVVQIGADSWLRTDGGWKHLPTGKLQDAVPSPAWLPDPAELLKGFFEGSPTPGFADLGSASSRAGACEVWLKTGHPAGPSFKESLCVGSKDALPHRIASGGPAIEAYLQVELYDYSAPIEIRPPQ
jgi:hypothetical protein